MLNVFTDRPAEDILGRLVHVTLGGKVYDLPVLTIGGNKRWKAQLDARLAGLLNGLEGLDDTAAILTVLSQQVDDLLDLLISYDTTGVLPPREEIEEVAYESELLTAVREVWRAANPFVIDALVVAAAATQMSDSSEPTNTSQPRTGGRRRSSRKN